MYESFKCKNEFLELKCVIEQMTKNTCYLLVKSLISLKNTQLIQLIIL